VVTHYQRLLNYIVPDYVHVLAGGRIVKSRRQGARARARGARLRLAATRRLNGLYLLDGAQHGDHQTFVEHIAEACASRELYCGVLDGQSHGVFNGKVFVDPQAQKTDGKQTNKALLLSPQAQRGHQAAARDLRRRREVHARRDCRPH
jgi:hypothetical protein